MRGKSTGLSGIKPLIAWEAFFYSVCFFISGWAYGTLGKTNLKISKTRGFFCCQFCLCLIIFKLVQFFSKAFSGSVDKIYKGQETE
jgi:hypothetical protein